jgi:hypothetical protein
VLGGDLPHSNWGEPQRARATFEYLKAHPWIQFLDADSVTILNPSPGERLSLSNIPTSPEDEKILKKFNNAPPSPLSDAALDAYLALYAPSALSSPELAALRGNYLGQVGMLLAAADWDVNPYSGLTCDPDLDMDGEAECILASREIFIIIEPHNGSMVFAFIRSESDVHQVIAPSSQFVVGLSDPSNWDLSAGRKADPAVILGAFADDYGPYQIIQDENQLIFQNEIVSKKYLLTPGGIRVEYKFEEPTRLQIPLALDPWERLQPGWSDGYLSKFSENGARLNTNSGFQVEIVASSKLSSLFFTDTFEIMGRQENPNYEFPPGHYLPFPLALLELEPSTGGSVEIRFLP